MVIGTTEAELTQLNKQVQQLCAAGLRAEYLSGDDLALCEPELGVGRESGAAFLPDDCQLDAHRTVAFIEKVVLVTLTVWLILMRVVGFCCLFSCLSCLCSLNILIMSCKQGNRLFASQARYAEFYHDPAVCLLRSIALCPHSCVSKQKGR